MVISLTVTLPRRNAVIHLSWSHRTNTSLDALSIYYTWKGIVVSKGICAVAVVFGYAREVWCLDHHDWVRLMAQLAEYWEQTEDSTEVWPETNEFAEMGEIVNDQLWTMDESNPVGEEQKKIIYDPILRYIDGIDVSDDPLLEVRTAVSLMSGRIRQRHLDESVEQAAR